MAIIEMKKISLIGLERDKVFVLKTLQEMGNVEIREITDLSEENSAMDRDISDDSAGVDLEQKLARVKFALEFLGHYNSEKKGMFTSRQAVTTAELDRIIEKQEELFYVVDQSRKLDEDLASMRSRRTRVVNLIGQMSPWRTLDIPLDALIDTDKTRVLIGTVSKEKAEAFQHILDLDVEEVFQELIGISKEDAHYLIIYHMGLDEIISERLKEYGFNRTTFTSIEGTPGEVIAQCEQDIKALDQEEIQVSENAKKLLFNISELEVLYDGLNIELDKYKAMERILHTDKAYMLNGWIPAWDQKMLVERLLSITEALYIQFDDPDDNEIFPVALDNPMVIQPFEAITSLYSTPHSRGLDPNLFMAPFYFTFFGMMVGDAGYGLILAIVAALFTRKLKPNGMVKKLGWLISLCGISTFIWGAIFGSWFGNIGTLIAQQFGLKSAVLWFDPMEEPILMLGLCFGLGIIHIFVGMGLQIYVSAKRGKLLDALFDQGLWIVLIIGLLLLATPLAQVGKIMSITGAIGLVLTQGRSRKNPIKRLLSGVLSLYNITGYLSDVLSYSRLFALGLATGVIGMVINTLGIMLGTSWYGWIIGILIMVGGHIFNLLINSLGAFVHSSRLQYIEFFGKFFEGGGHAFAPLRIKTKFIDLINKEAI
ncbi:MAG: V-type ATP synthase subunit I [Firmicutes bacterium]|nr:V-type ATP synthase subunit I [Bacillota bacterium]